MSATRDRSHQVLFLHENLYQITPKKRPLAMGAGVRTSGLTSGKVIKADSELARSASRLLHGKELRPGLNKELQTDEQVRVDAERDQSLEEIYQGVERLKSLQKKLHFLLRELDDIVKHRP